MTDNFNKIQELLNKKTDIEVRLKLLSYDGTPEIKTIDGSKFLYVRKRVAGKLTSTYVGAYSDDLYNLLLRNNNEGKNLRKELKHIEKELANLGYTNDELPIRVIQNIDFARANMKMNIYDQAVLEGISISFSQAEEILDNAKVNGVTATDVQKVLNLKHAWEFILDKDALAYKTDYYVLCHIARSVNEGFYMEGGRMRGVPISIGGTTYIPPLPNEYDVKEKIDEIISKTDEVVDKAIELCLYCIKTQIFLDGNKRASVIFANHYLISQGAGFIVIPESKVHEFKKLLINYYEGEDISVLISFMKKHCWKTF